MGKNDFTNKDHAHLLIDHPARYGVLIETKSAMEGKSLFKKVYCDAKENVSNIIIANENASSDKSEKFINTTIAFVGGRGEGKSSAMMSFASWLNGNGSEVYKDHRFYSIPVIDANQLGKNETIIGRISAALMTEYGKKKDGLTTEEKRDFIRTAKRVNDLAVKYCSGEWFKNSDTLIDDTVSISRMRDDVEKLIMQFLKVQMKSPDHNYLVVSIDDIDMGIENSYSIMEEIRKFLCVSNVIVLVSLDVKQLEMILKANYIKTLGRNNLDDSDVTIVRSLSYRYIEKLFPYSRQHRMPELTLSMLQDIFAENFMNDNDKNWKKSGVACLDNGTVPSVFNAILHMIWRKTMLILVCNSDGDHLLVPRNLRSLYNMVVFLRSLPDAVEFSDSEQSVGEVTYTNYKNVIDNLDAFKGYLLDNLETFEARGMSSTDQEMARILLNVISEFPDMTLTTMNSKIAADILYNLKAKNDENIYKHIFFNDNEYSAEAILEASVYPDSISLGDVMYVIGKIDAKTKCRYINYLAEVIRTLWSIEMTKDYYGFSQIKDENSVNDVSNRFIRAVGGIVVNPDKAKFCYLKDHAENENSKNKCWFIYDSKLTGDVDNAVNLFGKGPAGNDSYDEIIQRIGASMVTCIDKGDKKTWRIQRHLSKPYYECGPQAIYATFDDSICIHPYSLFTHIINDRTKNMLAKKTSLAAAVHKRYKDSELPNIPIPLYSMDFMYRWYETMRRYMQSMEDDNYLGCLKRMFNIKGVANIPIGTDGDGLIGGIQRYIPAKFVGSVIVTPLDIINKLIDELAQNHRLEEDEDGSKNLEQSDPVGAATTVAAEENPTSINRGEQQ